MGILNSEITETLYIEYSQLIERPDYGKLETEKHYTPDSKNPNRLY